MENNEKELDARGVLAELISYREESNQDSETQTSTLLRKLSLWIWLIGVLLLALGYFVVKEKLTIPTEYVLVYLFLFLASLLGTVVCTYLEFTQDKKLRAFLKDPESKILRSSDKRLKEEIALYARLDNYSLDSVIQTRNYFARKKSLVESVSSMLVGVLTKVGLLPAVMAVLVVIAKLNSDDSFSLISIAAFGLIGIYFFCFNLTEASVKFEEYQSILSDYIDIRERAK